jgi:hypothetical protein
MYTGFKTNPQEVEPNEERTLSDSVREVQAGAAVRSENGTGGTGGQGEGVSGTRKEEERNGGKKIHK